MDLDNMMNHQVMHQKYSTETFKSFSQISGASKINRKQSLAKKYTSFNT